MAKEELERELSEARFTVAYWQGVIFGFRSYAWRGEDDVLYVGKGDKTLAEAIKNTEKAWLTPAREKMAKLLEEKKREQSG